MSYNILVVDDSAIVRSLIGKTIELAGVDTENVLFAKNGQEALDLLKENWFDVILSDINMPVMNGVEMIKIISEDDIMREIPIIVISTEGSTTRIKELKDLGIRGYIRKPFTPEMIKDVITKVVIEDKTYNLGEEL